MAKSSYKAKKPVATAPKRPARTVKPVSNKKQKQIAKRVKFLKSRDAHKQISELGMMDEDLVRGISNRSAKRAAAAAAAGNSKSSSSLGMNEEQGQQLRGTTLGLPSSMQSAETLEMLMRRVSNL